ncbi:hypothetical protein [Algoriphagus sediminis]|uniref:DUF2868 domain-containing protein n=1 Tax=Algoriphagus sediminis TaxID=3057113 RepID=A0ABT7YCB2_9BACT|nr:hypothetical protein [Algoriphagus sediminis]MDN3204169.1 hypothetical protein [Algoriphagus sediminis]
MKDQELINVWKSQEAQIDKLWAINKILFQERVQRKTSEAMLGWKSEKILGLVVGFIYLLFLGFLFGIGLSSGSYLNNYFLISVGFIFLINLKVYIDYIRHLVMSFRIDFSGPVVEIQAKLMEMKISLIKGMKIWVLQIPFYTTFHLSASWFPHDAAPAWVGVQVAITFLFILGTVWVTWTLREENLHSKSAKFLISATGGDPLDKALAVYQEVKEFEN